MLVVHLQGALAMPSYTPWIAVAGVLLAALIAALSGVVGVALGAALTLLREVLMQRRKEQKDVAHLVGLVAGALERFSSACANTANDDGELTYPPGEEPFRVDRTKDPEFSVDKLDVEWKALPADLMFKILDLPYRIDEAHRFIEGASEHAAFPPDFEEYYEERRYQFSILGADAGRLAASLRRYAKVPARQRNPHWDSIKFMDDTRAAIEKRRAEPADYSWLPTPSPAPPPAVAD